ncbi:MAG: hypothetical protein EU548_03580 [Promethearchaeota archaeon]|nr:MAG: hypothetical protein EU548_03580 [Candidatus Lokiarchaeota archaeon]
MNIEIPTVSKASGKHQEFDSAKIFNSLRKETTLTFSQAHFVTKDVVKFIITSSIKFLSGPLIREIVNVILLQHGLEKQRLEYTRIGFPMHDLEQILTNETYLSTQKIVQHVTSEYEAVKKLIEERE